jgi:hypothetical protein
MTFRVLPLASWAHEADKKGRGVHTSTLHYGANVRGLPTPEVRRTPLLGTWVTTNKREGRNCDALAPFRSLSSCLETPLRAGTPRSGRSMDTLPHPSGGTPLQATAASRSNEIRRFIAGHLSSLARTFFRLRPDAANTAPVPLARPVMAIIGEFGKRRLPQAGERIDATDAQCFAHAALVAFSQF